MVEIIYDGQYEVADLAGKSLANVRREYQAKFDIPNKAAARLNDRKVKPNQESDIMLCDSDEVRFVRKMAGKKVFLLGAFLLALVGSSGVFASGYLTNTTTLNVLSAGGDFASITAAPGQPAWTVWGSLKGAIGSGNLFIVDTSAANYPGDLVVTVSIVNGGELVKVYRTLNLRLYATSSNGTPIDINSDGIVSLDDTTLLNLNNGEASLYINQFAGSDNYTIRVKNGYYVSNIHGQGWPSGAHQPVLYAQVTQR
jgi:hypothetical protein